MWLCCLTAVIAPAQKTYKYDSYDNDPMKARIYTLDNGLKVYLTVNRNQPRIQTYIAVRTGSRNDPAETTGLAHYLEHLLFKGTDSFGTLDYETERPLLDSIRDLYEVYRHTTAPEERKAIYHHIDSISHLASTYAIANEYDKLMASIGAEGSNAHTSEDETVYQEDIPANELENWAIVESDRFKHMVIRGFHTELEAVYEEYNRSLTSDFRKIFEKSDHILFPHHPYGNQTTLGSQEHLKNPSIVNIENYFHKYYVPNNMAICMSGDLDFDQTIALIDRYFGDMQARPVEAPVFPDDPQLTTPQRADVYGLQQEMVSLAWATPGNTAGARESLLTDIVAQILQNGKTGLIDLDLTQQQKVLAAEVFPYSKNDHTTFYLVGLPKEGQTLDEVRDLLLQEVRKVIDGDFDAGLLRGIINNKKLSDMRDLESNEARATTFYNYFIAGRDWTDFVHENELLSKLTKQDVTDFARKYLPLNAYAIIYKHQQADPDEKKIDKPAISPIEMNRDKTSQFVADVTARSVEPIRPVFADFAKDMTTATLKNGSTLLYKENTQNGIFTLRYIVRYGNKQDKLLDLATDLMDYLGTASKSIEQIQSELYQLACNVSVSSSDLTTTIAVNGLAENQEQAIAIMEDWIRNMQPDQEKLNTLVTDALRGRELAKTDQNNCERRLRAYAMYGPKNSYTDIASAEELKAARADELVKKLQQLALYPQEAIYYGPSSQADISKLIAKTHKVNESVQKDYSEPTYAEQYQLQRTTANEVFVAPYETKAVKLTQYSDNGEKTDASLLPEIQLFNEYFGGSMNSIVFQELRESRGLAYSAGATYASPWMKDADNYFMTMIGSQNDKMADCIDVFHDITENLPLAQNSFDLAKESLLKQMATRRYVGDEVLSLYRTMRRAGFDHDIHADIYPRVQQLTIDDLANFARRHVSSRTYRYIVLGDEQNLDMQKLSTLGTVHSLTLEYIFGY